MHISTETIQQMRDGRVRDRLWLTYAPDSVQAVNETMISLLGELLQYRDAEAAAESEEPLDDMLRERDRQSFNAGFEAGFHATTERPPTALEVSAADWGKMS